MLEGKLDCCEPVHLNDQDSQHVVENREVPKASVWHLVSHPGDQRDEGQGLGQGDQKIALKDNKVITAGNFYQFIISFRFKEMFFCPYPYPQHN